MIELPKGRISGRPLRALVRAVRSTPAHHLVSKVFRHDLGIGALFDLPADARGPLSALATPVRARADHRRGTKNLGVPASDGWPRSAATLGAAYRAGRTTPTRVARVGIDAAREFATRRPSQGPIHVFAESRAMADADAALERIESGKARGPLDGIPVVIKEEVDVAGLPTRLGTGWMPSEEAAVDAAAVERLRTAGAVILGLTPMTEYGMSPLGGNVHRAMPRNAHDPGHLPGGSSSGSAVAVATGVVPVALGADGGGSIRTPAAYNGVFGLKPTYGRIPTTGHGMPTGSTVVHLGPLGATTFDLAAFTQACSGADAGDDASASQPALDDLLEALGRGVEGLRIGVIESEWSDADSACATLAREALRTLEAEGASIHSVQVPLAAHAPAIGYVTIGLETYSALRDVRREHLSELGPDNQLLMSVLEAWRPDDYLDAQRVRTKLRAQVAAVLRDVDVIALPTAAGTAPAVSEDEATRGFLDSVALATACRFAFLGNLTGLPGGTAPVGRAPNGLPVGLQILGDAWDEAAVLQTLAHLERTGVACSERPPTHVDLLR